MKRRFFVHFFILHFCDIIYKRVNGFFCRCPARAETHYFFAAFGVAPKLGQTVLWQKFNLLIGERSAERIKIEIGTAYKLDEDLTLEVKGRNLINGLPKNAIISSEDVRDALRESLEKIIEAVKETLERTPPELAADIIDSGITLTGGGAMLRGLDKLISAETGIDVYVAENPLDCVANGTGYVLEHMDTLKEVLQESNRTI